MLPAVPITYTHKIQIDKVYEQNAHTHSPTEEHKHTSPRLLFCLAAKREKFHFQIGGAHSSPAPTLCVCLVPRTKSNNSFNGFRMNYGTHLYTRTAALHRRYTSPAHSISAHWWGIGFVFSQRHDKERNTRNKNNKINTLRHRDTFM